MEEDRKFELCFTPKNDYWLDKLGVKVCAISERVGGEIKNRIVFRRGSRSTGINLVHKRIEDAKGVEGEEVVVLDEEAKILTPLEAPLLENFYYMRNFAKDLVDNGILDSLSQASAYERVYEEEELELSKEFRGELAKKILEIAPEPEVREDFEFFLIDE